MKDAVVCAASSGKPSNVLISVARSEIGIRRVRKLATTEAKKAKLEFFRNGYVWSAKTRDLAEAMHLLQLFDHSHSSQSP